MKRLALVVPVALLLAARAVAQEPVAGLPPAAPSAPSSSQGAVFRSSANLVTLNVAVTDGKQFIGGLQPDDFAVFEDGVKQSVRFFESQHVPLDLILLLDTSSSMRDKLDVVHEAALGFLKSLRRDDRGAVVAFNDGVQVLQTLTAEQAMLQAAVRRTQAVGGTALHNALYVAMKQFGRPTGPSAAVRRQAIAVLSDGQDTVSLLSFDDVLAEARRRGVSIYTIALKSPRPQYTTAERRSYSDSDFSMRTLAQETGAQAFVVTDIQELKGIYRRIADELASQYSIGYAPTNPRPDGRFRRILVRLLSRPELKLRARSGYLAEGSGAIGASPELPPVR